MLIVIPIFIIVRFIYHKCVKNTVDIKREILLLLFTIFIVGLLSQALTGNFNIRNINIDNINIIPFKIVYDVYKETVVYNNINSFLISFLGNIIMFIPIGFLVLLLFKKTDKQVIQIGFLISLTIEISQLFLGRKTDIDDLLLNTLGVFIGVIIYKKIKKDKML